MARLKRLLSKILYRPYRHPGIFRISLAVLLLGMLVTYSVIFWPVEQVGLEGELAVHPLPLVGLPEKLGAFIADANAEGKPLAQRLPDCWGSSGFPLAARTPDGAVPMGGAGWDGLQRAIAHISRKNYQQALDILGSILPVPDRIDGETIRKSSEPSLSGNDARIFCGLVRYHQGIAFLRLSEANANNPHNLEGIVQQAVFTLRLSLQHLERLNNPKYSNSRYTAWREEDRAWDSVSLSSEYGYFPLRFVYGALGVGYLRAKDIAHDGYPRADFEYAAAQKEKYGQDAESLASTARGFLDAADEAVRNSGESGPDSETVALWRLAMGFSNVGLGALNLSAKDPLYHYTAGILLSALAGKATDDGLKNKAWNLALHQLAVADGRPPRQSRPTKTEARILRRLKTFVAVTANLPSLPDRLWETVARTGRPPNRTGRTRLMFMRIHSVHRLSASSRRFRQPGSKRNNLPLRFWPGTNKRRWRCCRMFRIRHQ